MLSKSLLLFSLLSSDVSLASESTLLSLSEDCINSEVVELLILVKLTLELVVVALLILVELTLELVVVDDEDASGSTSVGLLTVVHPVRKIIVTIKPVAES